MKTDRKNHRRTAFGAAAAIRGFDIFFILVWCLIAASMGAWFMLLLASPIAAILVFRLICILKPAKDDPVDMQEADFPDFQSMHSAVEDVFGRAANRDRTDAQSRRSPRFCHNCRFWTHNTAQFCPKCGRPVP